MEAITRDLARVARIIAEKEKKLETAIEANKERLIGVLEVALADLRAEKASRSATRDQLILNASIAAAPGKNPPVALCGGLFPLYANALLFFLCLF